MTLTKHVTVHVVHQAHGRHHYRRMSGHLHRKPPSGQQHHARQPGTLIGRNRCHRFMTRNAPRRNMLGGSHSRVEENYAAGDCQQGETAMIQ